jgi:uncharacterized integral membrane protein
MSYPCLSRAKPEIEKLKKLNPLLLGGTAILWIIRLLAPIILVLFAFKNRKPIQKPVVLSLYWQIPSSHVVLKDR